jgi:glycosyltransferase 2 family protein
MVKYIFRISVSIVLIAYFSFKVDWSIIFHSFSEITILWYILSTLIGIICASSLAFKHYLLIKGTRLELSITRLVIITFISRFYALLLPSALGTEAVRWYKVTKNETGRSFFLASIMVERLFFLLILLLFGTIPLFINQGNDQIILLRHKIMPFIISAYIILFIILFYFLFPKLQSAIKQCIKRLIHFKKGTKIKRFLENFSLKNSSFSIISAILAISLMWQFFFIGRMFFLFYAMNLQLNLINITWMSSLILLLQVIPVSFAGLGIREGAFAYLFTLFGLEAEKGFLLGILFFTQMLVFSAIGAILNIFES